MYDCNCSGEGEVESPVERAQHPVPSLMYRPGTEYTTGYYRCVCGEL